MRKFTAIILQMVQVPFSLLFGEISIKKSGDLHRYYRDNKLILENLKSEKITHRQNVIIDGKIVFSISSGIKDGTFEKEDFGVNSMMFFGSDNLRVQITAPFLNGKKMLSVFLEEELIELFFLTKMGVLEPCDSETIESFEKLEMLTRETLKANQSKMKTTQPEKK